MTSGERDETNEQAVPADRIEAVAQVLYEARINREPLGPLPDELRPVSADEAQVIDDRVAALSGWAVRGWKIGCTSEHAQQMLGSPGPFTGRVYSVFESGATLSGSDLAIEPNLEGELAFRFGSDIAPSADPIDRAALIGAVSEGMPAIEFVGGRFHDFLGTPLHCLMADAGANTHLVLGSPKTDVDLETLGDAAATMTVDGEVTGSGVGADVLGHPLNALAWLVDHLGGRGIGLEAGQVVTTGTATQVSGLPVGGTATADFAGVGSVSVSRVQ